MAAKRRQQRSVRHRGVAFAVQFLIDASGATRRQLADFYGKDPSTITDRLKETDPTVISVDDADVFAQFFDVGIDVLWMTEEQLVEWLTPERHQRLRYRIADLGIDLTGRTGGGSDVGLGETGWLRAIGPETYAEDTLDLREGVPAMSNPEPQLMLAGSR